MQMDEKLDSSSSQAGASNQRLAIITQLFKVAPNLHHSDELFLWVARTITQRFDVQVVEFWTTRAGMINQTPTTELRAIACQDTSLPRHVVWNNQISVLAERILQEQRRSTLAAAIDIFTAHQASLLNRYGLNYCCGYFLSTHPPGYDLYNERASTISSLLFLRYALPQSLLTSIGLILEQSMLIAKNRGLLVPTQSLAPSISPQQQPELIPRRSQNSELMRWSNPLASSVDIANKQARRLYTAIDGLQNLGELSETTGLNTEDMYEAVQTLLGQHRIELYEPGGQPVKNPRL